MKANAPEKIYLVPLPCGNFKLEWFVNTIHSDDVEYIRTDVFIEKVAEWLKLYVLNNDTIDIFEMEEQFKNYMKGE